MGKKKKQFGGKGERAEGSFGFGEFVDESGQSLSPEEEEMFHNLLKLPNIDKRKGRRGHIDTFRRLRKSIEATAVELRDGDDMISAPSGQEGMLTLIPRKDGVKLYRAMAHISQGLYADLITLGDSKTARKANKILKKSRKRMASVRIDKKQERKTQDQAWKNAY